MNGVRRKGSFVRWILPLLALAGGLLLIAVVAIYFALAPRPVVQQSSAYRSPDGEWQATMEEIDNGMGMGLGALYYEVHVHRAGATIRRHGDAERSVVFYINSADVSPPRLLWTASRRLAIEYHQGVTYGPGKKVERVGEITIEYQRATP